MRSKIIYIAIVMFSLSMNVVSAQNMFGVKVGINASDLKYGFEDPSLNPFEPDIYTGVAIGCEISWSLMKRIYLVSGMEYSEKGRKDYTKRFGTNGQRDLTMQYLSFPLGIEFPVWKRLTVRAGVELNYMIKISHNLIYDLRLFDYGPRLELGWTQQNLRFAVAGYHGARPFFGFPLSEPNFDVTMKNLQFSVAYIIREKTD